MAKLKKNEGWVVDTLIELPPFQQPDGSLVKIKRYTHKKCGVPMLWYDTPEFCVTCVVEENGS